MEWLIDNLTSVLTGSGTFGLIWIIMIIDCITNKRLSRDSRVGWILLMFFTNFVGAIIYFFTGNSQLYRFLFMTAEEREKEDRKAEKAKKKKSQKYASDEQLATPVAQPLPYEEDNRYEQGYRSQQPAYTPPYERKVVTYDSYDQPQAAYPEMRQEQQMR